METINQTFKGIIPPIRVDVSNGNGGIIPIIDWSAIAVKHTPLLASNVQLEFILEYLTITYYLPTLLKIPGSSYPEFKASDKGLQRALKTVEFKRSFLPENNYSVQFLLWNWFAGSWRNEPFDRDFLFNAGMENRLNLIKPYLVSVGDTVYGDKLYKLGISIAPRYLQEGDYLEISGGYSGSISYLWDEPEIVLNPGQSGQVEITSSASRIVNFNAKRAALYVANEGENRCYWRFGPEMAMDAGTSPYLDPGQSLTIEHGKLFSNGGDNHKFLGKFANSIVRSSLLAVCKTGTTKMVYQELVYP